MLDNNTSIILGTTEWYQEADSNSPSTMTTGLLELPQTGTISNNSGILNIASVESLEMLPELMDPSTKNTINTFEEINK